MNVPLTTESSRSTILPVPALEPRGELPVIFGLRYLEEEAVEIHDIVGCAMKPDPNSTATGGDDTDVD